jgi:hypothetical protein
MAAEAVDLLVNGVTGGILGAMARFAPEVIGFFDRKNERAHENDMQKASALAAKEQADYNLRLIELNAKNATGVAAQQLELTQAAGANADNLALIQALQSSVVAQGQLTGNVWVDGLNQLIRPGVCAAMVGFYLFLKLATFIYGLATGVALPALMPLVWTGEDTAIMSSTLSFFYLNRVLVK